MFAPAPKKIKKARKSTDDTTGESVPEPVDVLVDSIIGFLEQSTAYLRTVANQTFSLISGAVQENTLDLIVSVSQYFISWRTNANIAQQLERRNPAELVEDDDDDMEDVEEDSRSDIISVASQATNTYRQCQDVQLIQVLTNHIPAFVRTSHFAIQTMADDIHSPTKPKRS